MMENSLGTLLSESKVESSLILLFFSCLLAAYQL